MPSLAQHRCFIHPIREASARCPSCRQSFCRECVTEHDGRILCATCLRKSVAPEVRPKRDFTRFLRPVPVLAGIGLAWLAFYAVGSLLLRTPSEWHEGRAAEAAIIGIP